MSEVFGDFVFFIGGGCRLCGSVEHMKKDCPESQNSGEISGPPLEGVRLNIPMSFC